MEIILEWIRTFIILFLLLASFLYLVPRESYRKYIRFFMEMILIMTLVHPVLDFIYHMDEAEMKRRWHTISQEIKAREKEALEMTYLDVEYISYGLGEEPKVEGEEATE